MKKIAFYVANSNIDVVDYRHFEKGNPGIGGTPYLIILIATELAKRDNGLDVTLFVNSKGIFHENLNIIQVDDCVQSINIADSKNYDYIIINAMYIDWSQFSFYTLKSNLRIIPWCHNFYKYSWNNIFYKENKIARVVTVSREQLDLLRDHKVFEKGDYIFNAVPYDKNVLKLDSIIPINKRKHSVVYMGSLLPEKSFHELASIWPYIIEQVPDAELYVIGSGQLYNKSVLLGKYGLSPESYEKQFMKFLTDPSGNILPSVHFLGSMGMEKFDVLRESKVAVPNPKGKGETFCISAVEMQLMGCNVTSMQAPGYLDTVYNGILVKTKKELIESIVSLLNTANFVKDYNETLTYINNNFSINAVISDWEKLLLSDMKKPIHPITPLYNPYYRLKFLKERIRRSKSLHFISYFLPSIDFYYSIYESLRDRKHL